MGQSARRRTDADATNESFSACWIFCGKLWRSPALYGTNVTLFPRCATDAAVRGRYNSRKVIAENEKIVREGQPTSKRPLKTRAAFRSFPGCCAVRSGAPLIRGGYSTYRNNDPGLRMRHVVPPRVPGHAPEASFQTGSKRQDG